MIIKGNFLINEQNLKNVTLPTHFGPPLIINHKGPDGEIILPDNMPLMDNFNNESLIVNYKGLEVDQAQLPPHIILMDNMKNRITDLREESQKKEDVSHANKLK